MNIFEPNSLLLFILFFVPGFVSMKIYDILVPNESRSNPAYVFDAVAYSTINFICAWPFLASIYHEQHLSSFYLFFTFLLILFIFPSIIAIAAVKVLSLSFIKKQAPGLATRPWDVVFDKETGYWVIVHLKNGEQIAGEFSTASAASYHPREEQIYLEQVVNINPDGTVNRLTGSKGVIIMGSEIVMIELFNNEVKNQNEHQ